MTSFALRRSPRARLTATVGAALLAASMAPVNTTLGKFPEAVHIFNAAYPFYSADEDDESWSRVANEIEERLVDSDAMAGAFQGYWEDVLSSVGIGDYSTELITEGLPDD